MFYIFAIEIQCISNIFKISNRKYKKKMKVSKTIIEKILNDNAFSADLAGVLNIQQQSVLGLARRNSEKLTLWKAVKFYKKKGFSEEQIFEDESENVGEIRKND